MAEGVDKGLSVWRVSQIMEAQTPSGSERVCAPAKEKYEVSKRLTLNESARNYS